MARRKRKKVSFKEQFKALKNLPPFLRLVWNTSPYYSIVNLLLRIVKSALPLAILWVAKEIIDEVIRLISLDGQGDMTYLWTVVAIELVLASVSDILNRWIILIDALLGDLFANKTSVQLIEKAASLDLFMFEDAKFYDKLAMARRQTIGRTVLLSQVLYQLQDMITIAFLAVGLIAFSPWLILILLLAVIPAFVNETYFNSVTYSLTRNWTPQRRELDYLRYIGASDETAKEIKVFSLQNFIGDRFAELAHKYYNANKKVSISRAIWGSLLSVVGTLAYYGAFVFIIMQTVSGIITVGMLTFLSSSFNRLRSMLQGIMSRFSKIADNALYLQDFFEFMAIEPVISSPENALSIPQPIQQGFVFENVSFKYPGTEFYAIKELSFHLRPGDKLALVGENGAGKTTLVKLLARLYEPTEGRILLDGKDLRQYSLQELRLAVGVIFQDFVKFQLQAKENIAIGQIDQLANQDRIENSALKSLANEVIEDLPGKYDQILGRRFESGVDLSGGQWQKIALARAYMRDAQLLILDEPTSALDARAEHEVFLRFSELIKGKSAVLISHRFSTVRMADRILFLEKGMLKEIGSHEELLALDGKYAELFKLQAQGYL